MKLNEIVEKGISNPYDLGNHPIWIKVGDKVRVNTDDFIWKINDLSFGIIMTYRENFKKWFRIFARKRYKSILTRTD